MSENAKLKIGSKDFDFPIKKGSVGPSVIDVSKLYAETDHFTFDPGFTSTGSCESSITYIDGDKGQCYYRGYPMDTLAEKSNFLEIAYLLWYGELPTKIEWEEFSDAIKNHTMVHEQIRVFFNGFRRGAHPMAIMVASVAALSAFYPDSINIKDPEQRRISARRMVAKIPTLAAMAYKYSLGQPFIYPDNSLDYSENFLQMCFAVPAEKYRINKVFAKALDKIFILHADHEQNASTSTVRLASSSQANPFACIAAGIAALWGPSHGGANEAVVKMLDEIGDVSRIDEFVARAKDKNDPFRLMGFGHRVYKNFDPRAKVMKQAADEVLAELGIQDENLEIAKRLEEIALSDPYFIEKKLYPNVDFYSGIILKALGIPTSMFTVIFAVGRTVGWVAHWNEMIGGSYRIGRPRQLYTGYQARDFVSVENR